MPKLETSIVNEARRVARFARRRRQRRELKDTDQELKLAQKTYARRRRIEG
jgi:hypothetical protein